MVKYQHVSKHLKNRCTRLSPAAKLLGIEPFTAATRKTSENSSPIALRAAQQPQQGSGAVPSNANLRQIPTFLRDDEALTNQAGFDNDSSDGEFSEDWDEGRTLIENLGNTEDEEHDSLLEEHMARADELHVCMTERSKDIQKDVADTLVPAMDHIRLIHGLLEDSVESKLTAGTLNFDEAADDYQKTAAACRSDLLEMVKTSNFTLRELFNSLKNEYVHKSQLSVDFEAKFKEIRASASRLLVEETAKEFNDLKLKLDQKVVVLSKTEKSNKQNMLVKNILGKK
ncbi:hypothetical protein FRB95_011577 [Tulasnella sp. JGI-2019a]|nr:hypothetical protein FRB95_011577 [Tulasnella sp. JGI-2019a]